MTNVNEIWLPIAGYENLYEVSNLGRVRSLTREIVTSNKKGYWLKGKLIKPFAKENLYQHVCLCKAGKPKSIYLHRIVAKAFLPNPDNKPQVNHINGNPQDNRVENLEWVTVSENHRHAYDVLKRPGANTGRTGALCHKSKPVKMLDLTGSIIKVFPAVVEASRQLSIREDIIRYHIYLNRPFRGFYWQYV